MWPVRILCRLGRMVFLNLCSSYILDYVLIVTCFTSFRNMNLPISPEGSREFYDCTFCWVEGVNKETVVADILRILTCDIQTDFSRTLRNSCRIPWPGPTPFPVVDNTSFWTWNEDGWLFTWSTQRLFNVNKPTPFVYNKCRTYFGFYSKAIVSWNHNNISVSW
jgi:hypothetical protein